MSLRYETGLILATFAIGAWLAAAMPVFAQEAYYWTYAQHPDLSYFDHPPMVAWSIWIATQIFGEGLLSLRITTWLYACGSTWIGLALLREFHAGAKARSAWIVGSVAVPGWIGSRFYTTPDAPLLFFWSLCIFSLWRARGGQTRWWLLSGLAAGLALTSKYSALFLAVGGVLTMAADPRLRAQWTRRGPWLALGLALIAFSPVIYWNYTHELESFAFQSAGRFDRAQFSLRWAINALLAQVLILHPLVFVLLPAALIWLARQWRRGDERALWLLAFGVPLAGFVSLGSFWIQTKLNWVLPAYFTLLLGACLWWSESGVVERRPRMARAARAIFIATALLAMASPLMRAVPQRSGTTWYGWTQIAARAEAWRSRAEVEESGPQPFFFCAADHRDAAQLWRALYFSNEGLTSAADSDPQRALAPVLSEILFGKPALQFDHWSSPHDLIGHDGLFVLTRPERRSSYPDLLRRVFESAEPVERVRVEVFGRTVLEADLWLCRRYRGADARTGDTPR